jgi:hypothetical protein
MPQDEVAVVKSPIIPVEFGDEDTMPHGNELTYYVRLPNGMIATKPEDFLDDSLTEEVEEAADE